VLDASQFKHTELPPGPQKRFWRAYGDLAQVQGDVARRADLGFPFDVPSVGQPQPMGDLALRLLLEEVWPGLNQKVTAHLTEFFASWQKFRAWTFELLKAKQWLHEQWQAATDQLNEVSERRWWHRLRRKP
jgi:hypothetical protein